MKSLQLTIAEMKRSSEFRICMLTTGRWKMPQVSWNIQFTTGFSLRVLFYMKFAVFLFFVIFNCRNCLIYNLKCHQKKKLNCKKEIDLFAMMESKHKKFAPQEKGFRQMRLNFKWRSVKKKMQYLVAKVYFKTLFAISISCYITWISLNQVCDENYFF